tara:strand:- start:71 stop:262 length:192 start_codon:yes stop_codon:yes gene_type:complete
MRNTELIDKRFMQLDAKLKTLNFLISRPDTSREEFKEVINQTGIVLDDLKSLINRNLDPLRNG